MPISQSAFARMSAASASPRYSSSLLIESNASRMASSSRDATHSRSIGLRVPAYETMRWKMLSPSRSGVARVDQDVIRIRLEQTRDERGYWRSAPRCLLTFHFHPPVGSRGRASMLHLSQPRSWYSSGVSRSTRCPWAHVTASAPHPIQPSSAFPPPNAAAMAWATECFSAMMSLPMMSFLFLSDRCLDGSRIFRDMGRAASMMGAAGLFVFDVTV